MLIENILILQQYNINGSDTNSIDAKLIYDYLELKEDFTNWVKRTIDKYDFIESEDYVRYVSTSLGNSEVKKGLSLRGKKTNYIVTLDMAKELCMVSNTTNGKATRKYFIEVEKQANKPKTFEEMAKELITLADIRIKELETKIKLDAPNVAVAKTLAGSDDDIDFATFSRTLFDKEQIKLGRNKLLAWFRENRYITSKNEPYINQVKAGNLRLKTGTYKGKTLGSGHLIHKQVRITGKGVVFFTKKLLKAFPKRK